MVKYITRAVFKQIVKRRSKSETIVLRARVKNAEALYEWKAAYFLRLYHASRAPPGLELLHKR